MKSLAILALLLFAVSPAAFAAPVHVLIPNWSSYTQGMICIVDAGYNSQFSNLIHASDFATDRTDRNSALKLMSFFKDVDVDACYVPKGSSQHVNVENRDNVYVVTILMRVAGDRATNVYWNITNLDGHIEQYVTVDAPAL